MVTGSATTAGGTTHAFLYSNGAMTDLGTLGGTISFGEAINSSGQITGQAYLSGNDAAHAFLYSNGEMVDLNSAIGSAASVYTLIDARGINDSGQIIVVGLVTATSQPVMLLLIPNSAEAAVSSADAPVPLWALVALGVGLLVMVQLRARAR